MTVNLFTFQWCLRAPRTLRKGQWAGLSGFPLLISTGPTMLSVLSVLYIEDSA